MKPLSLPSPAIRSDAKKRAMADLNGGGGAWANLHSDLLADILSRLDVVDFIRALAVCAPWRCVPAKTANCRPSKPQIPWLMVSTRTITHAGGDLSSLCFYAPNFLTGEQTTKKYKLGLHEIAGCPFIGSSQGFLITAVDGGSTAVVAANPITGARLSFPVLDLLALVRGMATIPIPEERIVDDLKKFAYIKAVISPSLNAMAAMVFVVLDTDLQDPVDPPGVMYGFTSRRVVLSRVGAASWADPFSEVCSLGDIWTDILFRQDRLYAINTDGMLAIFDLNNPFASPLAIKLNCDFPWFEIGYLVESPDKNDLFVVYLGDSESSDKKRVIEVFQVDEGSGKVEQIRDLGEVAIFLSGSGSNAMFEPGFLDPETMSASSVSTLEYPNLRKNCVYFASLDSEDILGVYWLEDGSIQPLGDNDDCLRDLHESSSDLSLIWFTPAINRVKWSLCMC